MKALKSIRRMDSGQANFAGSLDALLDWESDFQEDVETVVREILQKVKCQGDRALIDYTRKFDRRQLNDARELLLGPAEIQAALSEISATERRALEQAAERIRTYHQRQVQESWQYQDDKGTVLGQKISPLDRVGLYVPGGKAAYPSSVLMSAIPASVAGVPEVVMVTPMPDGQGNNLVLAAAALAGVDSVMTVGGAQAVAAMAYGTETLKKVDKIVGPGNAYVAAAKKAVFGRVDIDMIAGPSEILIICDGKTPPDWIAMDLFSQAEHDEQAQSILLSPDEDFIEAVQSSIDRLLPDMQRKDIIAESLRTRGALIKVQSLHEAVEIANRIAPEHLELSVEDPQSLLASVLHAGAIFMGRYTSESLGDYCAGPNHVLPTSGTARFSSPLGVYDYIKRSSIISCSEKSAAELGKVASVLARGESLEAHALSAEYRIPAD